MTLNLKTTITQTENLKNKTKKALLNINEELIEKAETYNEVPQKIEKTMANYTKFAKGNLNRNLNLTGYGETKVKINLPILFRAEYLFFTFKKNNNIAKFYVLSGFSPSTGFAIFEGEDVTYGAGLNDLRISFKTIKDGEYEMVINNGNRGNTIEITDWVAVG